MTEGERWTWPDPPATPRDIIAGHFRNWGRSLAYGVADTLLIELSVRGFVVHPDGEKGQTDE